MLMLVYLQNFPGPLVTTVLEQRMGKYTFQYNNSINQFVTHHHCTLKIVLIQANSVQQRAQLQFFQGQTAVQQLMSWLLAHDKAMKGCD